MWIESDKRWKWYLPKGNLSERKSECERKIKNEIKVKVRKGEKEKKRKRESGIENLCEWKSESNRKNTGERKSESLQILANYGTLGTSREISGCWSKK